MMTNNLFEACTAANRIPFLYFKKAGGLKKKSPRQCHSGSFSRVETVREREWGGYLNKSVTPVYFYITLQQ